MSEKKGKAANCGAAKREKAPTQEQKQDEPTPTEKEQKKRARSKYFTVEETDFLLSLLMHSDLLSQKTNTNTPYGRVKTWEDLHRIFNASPKVNYREEKVLKSRVHNIRSGLSKLNTFSKQVASATGGGFLPPNDPPKVPFELTPTVREFAAVIAIKLNGLPACADSDGPTSSQSLSPSSSFQPLQSPIMSEEENETAELLKETNKSADLSSIGFEDSIPHATEDEGETIDSGMSTSLRSTPTPKPSGSSSNTSVRSSTPRPKPSGGKQFFATVTQQERKRQRVTSSHYYEQKASLVREESLRREKLHAIEMKIKAEELATKQQMTAFWKVATEKLSANIISIDDVVSVAAIRPPSTDLLSSTDPTTETMNLDDADIELYTDGEITADVTLGEEIEPPLSPLRHQSRFRQYDTSASESDEPFDNEDSDPTFKPKHSK